jgi:hypothetical protein
MYTVTRYNFSCHGNGRKNFLGPCNRDVLHRRLCEDSDKIQLFLKIDMKRDFAAGSSNGNDIKTKAERSFDLDFVFVIEGKRTLLNLHLIKIEAKRILFIPQIRKIESERNLFIPQIGQNETKPVYSTNSNERSRAKSVYSTNWKDRSEAKSVYCLFQKFKKSKQSELGLFQK